VTLARSSIGIGLLGIGVIGGQVAKVLTERAEFISQSIGCPVVLRRIKVLESDMRRPEVVLLGAGLFTTNDEEFFNYAGIDVVIELIGGEYPAFDYLKRAILAGKHVVTANKEVVAKHWDELLTLASQNNVSIRYEASVGGGIPLIAPFQRDLIANHICGIYAIINGTTNYILSTMASEGAEFSMALAQAQRLGYAESNPRNDVEGFDAAYKISILSSLAFRSRVHPEQVYCEGISRLSLQDFRYADEMGYAVKLLAISKHDGESIEARVHPVFISKDSFLAKVNGVYNAVLVDGDLTGQVTFSGKGAGALPTSSAVVADVIETARDIAFGRTRSVWQAIDSKPIKPMSEIITRYYIRISIADQAGVLAQVASTLGNHGISISSAIQKETISDQVAEIVIMTHPAAEYAMQAAVEDLHKLSVVREVRNFVRVEG